MSPHGEIPSQRSSSQPITAPTRTPATSSVDSRKPRAIADGSAVWRGPESCSGASRREQPRRPAVRYDRLCRACRQSYSRLAWFSGFACPAALKAARTILIAFLRVKEPLLRHKCLISSNKHRISVPKMARVRSADRRVKRSRARPCSAYVGQWYADKFAAPR